MADRDVLINENTMIAIANAIRNKSNSQTAYTPAQMPAAINQISGGSGSGSAITVTDTVDSHGGIIKTINAVDISDTTATAGDVASGKYFYTADGTKTAGISNMNKGYSVDQLASGKPDGDIILSNDIVSISPYAFAANNIESITGLNVTTLMQYSLYKCSNLSEINLPSLIEIGDYALSETNIEEIISSTITSIGTRGISNNPNLSKVVITSNFTSNQGNYWIQSNPSLRELRLPNATNLSPKGYGFQNCSSLDIYDIGKTGFLYLSSLPTTAPLSVLIMRKDNQIVNFQTGPSSLNSLAFAENGTGGTIFIPKVLYDHLGDGSSLDYKSSSNWAALDARGTVTWATIEGSVWE